MNRGEIRNRILRALNDPLDGSGFQTLAETNAVIDEAQEILAEEVRDLHRTCYFPMRGGQSWFDIRACAPDICAPYRLWSQTDERRLEYTSIDSMDTNRVRWLETLSERPTRWYGVTHDVFGIYPSLAGDASDVMRLDYLAWPKELDDDSRSPEFDGSLHDTLVLYGVYDGLLRRWDILRATDIFTQFVGHFTDRAFATEIKRYNHGFQRMRFDP
jgi:hypothetical protein